MSELRMDDDYAKNSVVQGSATDTSVNRGYFKAAVESYLKDNPSVAEDSTEAFRVAEFGCADGCNSMSIITSIVHAVRAFNQEKPILVTLTDLPNADWSGLFKRADKLQEQLKNESITNVFVHAAGKSFYSQLFPRASVDFAYTCTAIHWLSKAPCLKNNYSFYKGSTHETAETNEVWIKQAKEDLVQFYSMRNIELKPKGVLFVLSLGISDEPSEQDKLSLESLTGWTPKLKTVLDKHGVGEHLENFNFPVVHRFYSDLLPDKKQFQLILDEMFITELAPLKKLIDEDNIEEYIKLCKTMNKAVTGPFIRRGIKAIGIEEPEKVELICGELLDSAIDDMGAREKPPNKLWYSAKYFVLAMKSMK